MMFDNDDAAFDRDAAAADLVIAQARQRERERNRAEPEPQLNDRMMRAIEDRISREIGRALDIVESELDEIVKSFNEQLDDIRGRALDDVIATKARLNDQTDKTVARLEKISRSLAALERKTGSKDDVNVVNVTPIRRQHN
jgi:hypothetical protein